MRDSVFGTTLCAFLVVSAPSFAQIPQKPIKPGGVRITTRAPEPGKWDVINTANHTQRLFKCKPLACPDAETVVFKFSKSPTLHPDPKALEKFATVDWPKRLRALGAAQSVLSDRMQKFETLSSKVTVLKDYPSAVNESKLVRGKTAIYLNSAIIFAGPVMISIQSTSPDRALARSSLDAFIGVMQIVKGPPLPESPPSAKTPAGSQAPGTEHI